MKKVIGILIVLIVFSTGFEKGYAQQGKKWKLVWKEEFKKKGKPDPDKWDFEKGYIRNKELQYYTDRPENAVIEDGMLVISTLKDNFEGHPITSASLRTKGKQDFLYGRIEVRAKLPTGKGMWPAIWLLGNNISEIGWPECGEIDIMENVGFDPDIIHANVHTEAYNHVQGTNKGNKIEVTDPHLDFHIYAIEWSEDRIDFFVDDRKYFSFANENSGWKTWPFDQPHYLILNSAYGGSWGATEGTDDSILPQRFYVDYVRYYK